MVIKRGEAAAFGERSCVNRGLSTAREAGLCFASRSLLLQPWRCPCEPAELWFRAVSSAARTALSCLRNGEATDPTGACSGLLALSVLPVMLCLLPR